MRALFDKRLTPFTQALAGVRTWDVEAIHQSRIGSRRLRELVPLLELDHETQRSVGRQLRRVTRRLGRLRELDVLAKTLGELRRKGHAGHAIDQLEASVAGETLRTRDWLTRRLGERRLNASRRALEQIAGELKDRETTSRFSRLATAPSLAVGDRCASGTAGTSPPHGDRPNRRDVLVRRTSRRQDRAEEAPVCA